MLTTLAFLYPVKVKKIQKIDENSQDQRSNNSYLLRDLMNFNEIFGKNRTFHDINKSM